MFRAVRGDGVGVMDAGHDESPQRDVPLCVDLDGTLLRSDLLLESALALLRANPLYLLSFPVWLAAGKANLKRQIASRVDLDVSSLPYDARILAWLREDMAGRCRVLCSASDQPLVDAVAAHVGGFDDALGSDGVTNLAGERKADVLAERYGEQGFDYAGNAAADVPVWKRARRAVVVNAGASVERQAEQEFVVERVFEREPHPRRSWLRALRVHQWLKNLLVFVPLLTAHLLFEPGAVFKAGIAFVCLCLCASGTYVLNDLLDLQADRRHPRKKNRPFASGALSLQTGLVAALALIGGGFVLAVALPPSFVLALLGYCVLTLAYSLLLKRIPLLDVIVLAGLYTIRIIAGAAALQIATSSWLLAFSMFLFLSLAMVKRHAELLVLQGDGQSRASGRGYTTGDLPLVQSLGTTSGYLAVLVFALYINSAASEALYRRPHVLWLLCPLLLYWISRTWLITSRGGMHDDPVVFALTDPASRVLLAIACCVVFLSI